MSEMRSLHPLQLRASFQPKTLDAEARTVELTWTTGARVLRGFWDRFWEELSLDPKHVRMERLNNGAPFLADHDGYRVASTLGVVESATLEKGLGRAVVRFAKAEDDPEADRVFRKIRDGIIQNVSVGYRVHKMEKVEDGEDKIPVYRAVDWEPYELSAVAVGADDGAGFRSISGVEPNLCEIITRGPGPQKEKNVDNEEKTSPAQPTSGPSVDEVRAAAVRAERERATEIRALVKKHQLGEELAQRLVDQEVPMEKVRELVLEELFKRSQDQGVADAPSGMVGRGEDEREKRLRGMTAWLLERVHAVPMIEEAQKSKRFGRHFQGMALDGGAFRGMSLVDLARECLERSGVSTRGMDRMTLVGRAFTHRSGGMQTTSDFGVLFESVMHKVLLAAYAVTPDTWRQFCGTDTVSDFRPHNRFRNGSFGTLDELNEHGEYKRKAIPDGQKSTIETDTRGNIIALTRQAIINDDLGAFVDLATRFGRAAGLSIEVDVYALLTANSGLGATFNGNPFFHSSNANINTTGSALSVSGIDADAVVMAQQKDISNNEYLELQPYALVVPRGLRGEALVINEAQFEPTDNKFQKPNRVRGMFTNVVGTVRLTGTRRYLFADPSVAPAIKVVFLEGSGEAPMLESKDGWNIDGTEWKLRMDFLVQFFDPKGAVTNAGA